MDSRMNVGSGRMLFLDSLRGLAAYIVVVGHFFPEGWVKDLPIINLITDTKLAVALFFILSGVVLTNSGSQTKPSLFDLALQLVARFFRLLVPVFAVSIFVWFLYYFDLMYRGELPESYATWEAYFGFYRVDVGFMRVLQFAWIEAFFLFDSTTSLIPPAWTMRPEIFGSVVVLLYVWLVQRKLVSIYPSLLALASVGLVLSYGYLPFIYYFGFFVMGSAIRHVADQGVIKVRSPVVMLALVLITKTVLAAFSISNFQSDFLFGSLIIFYLLQAQSLHSFMCRPFLIWLGKVSFPLYLLHVPLIMSFGLHMMDFLGNHGVDSEVGQFPIFILLSLVLFMLSHIFLFFETLAIGISRSIRRVNKNLEKPLKRV
jgi:peptidoglycan/LPS O-acetylase OafA/YrhL